MATKSSAEQALHHGVIQDAIADIVTIIYRGGVQKESARSIVTEFATKAMKCALVQPVRPPHLEAKDWKSRWGAESLGVFLVSGGDDLTLAYSMKIFESGYTNREILEILGQLATVLSGVVRLIHCGLDPELLRR